MAYKNILDIKQELTVFLRNQDLISTTTRGVTTSQDTGTFSGAANHTLAINPTLVKNVRDVTVGGLPLGFGDDYSVDYSTGVISFNSSQTGAYVINYDQGNTDRIFPDFPQPTTKLLHYPRIAMDIISGNTNEYALGADGNISEYIVQINAYDRSISNVENMISDIREKIMENKKNFYNFKFITPSGMGPIISNPLGEQKVLQRNQDFLIRFVYEQ